MNPVVSILWSHSFKPNSMPSKITKTRQWSSRYFYNFCSTLKFSLLHIAEHSKSDATGSAREPSGYRDYGTYHDENRQSTTTGEMTIEGILKWSVYNLLCRLTYAVHCTTAMMMMTVRTLQSRSDTTYSF